MRSSGLLLSLVCCVALAADDTTSDIVIRSAGWQARSFRKIRETGKLVIGYFGGSITAGAGASKASETSYRALTTRWFREEFSTAEITEVNAAIGGTGSDLGVFRCSDDLLSRNPDLVFVEFAVNDTPAGESRVLRSMEGIVRKILRSNPAADIVFVYTINKNSMAGFYDRNEVPPTVLMHERIAERYGIPAVNVGKVLWRRAQAGEETWEALLPDKVHPSDSGYAIYAGEIRAFLEKHVRDEAGGSRTVPESLTESPLEQAHLVDVSKLDAEGWSQSDQAAAKFFPRSISASTPGTKLEYSFEGTAFGIYWIIAPDSGDIEWWMDGDPPKRVSSWDSYALRFSRKNYTIFNDSLAPGRHKVTIRVLDTRSAQSTGTAIRIGALLVNGPAQ